MSENCGLLTKFIEESVIIHIKNVLEILYFGMEYIDYFLVRINLPNTLGLDVLHFKRGRFDEEILLLPLW